MRIAFVSIPRFPCAVEVQRNLRWAGKPLIVGDTDQPKHVLDCSPEAAGDGVRAGMTLRQALAQSPGAMVVPPDRVLYGNVWEAVLDAFEEITPEVEDSDLGRAYLNVAGLERHYAGEDALCQRIIAAVKEASGLVSAIGLAEGKFPALAASTSVAPGEARMLTRGGEAAFLAPLPVELLPIDQEAIDRLRLFGLDTLGEVAALTLPELQSQFGFAGRRIWQLANGIDEEPLWPRPRTQTLSDSFSFEEPVAGIDVMVAVAKQLLSRLGPALNGRAARELTLQAELDSNRGWERRLVFREAICEGEQLAFVLRSTLQNAPPPRAVRSFCLRLGGLTGQTGKQLTLGDHGRLQRQLEESVRQLKARYGFSPIYRCVDVESWSVVPEERQILVESDA
jgi:nucleotidyltransferase/DNA polymerase involved in DNA repair